MYIRNDGKGESNITQNGFTAYLLSAVAHRKADYLHAKQRRQAREVLTDPDDLSTEESPGILIRPTCFAALKMPRLRRF